MSSLVITFTARTERGNIVIELDDEMNQGKTRFLYGEKAYFRVYYDPSLTLSVTASDGTIQDEGSGSSVEEEFFHFIDNPEQTVTKPISSIVSVEWYGNSLGSIIKKDLFTIQCSGQPDPKTNVAIAQVKYSSFFRRFSITVGNKNKDEYPVLVSAYGGV